MFNRSVKLIAAAVGCLVIAGSVVAADDVVVRKNLRKPPAKVTYQVFGLIQMDANTGLWTTVLNVT